MVTGGCGFIGQHLVRLLRDRGETVRVLDRDPIDLGEDVEVLRGSILDPDRVAQATKGVDRVFHLAANPNLWSARKSEFGRTNTEGTRIVLEAALRAEVERFVYTSTESILRGLAPRAEDDQSPSDERISASLSDMPGPYCRSKFLAEELAREAAEAGLPVVIVNPTLPIGPGDRLLTPPSRMLLGYLSGEFPAYLDSAFNMIDVRDAAQGHILAAEQGRIGERYILGGENLRLSELLAILSELTGRPMPRWRVPYWLAYASACLEEAFCTFVTKRPPTAPLTGVRLARAPMTFDNTKAVRDLGLTARPIRHSLHDAIAWFVAQGHLPAEVQRSAASEHPAWPQMRAGE